MAESSGGGPSTKTGYEHQTPVTAEALSVLQEALARNSGTGNAPVLPAPRDASACVGSSRVHAWWNRADRLAGLEPKRGRGWHSLRRKFATDLMDLPLKVLCELGGWKDAQTVLRCYQQADEVQLRKAPRQPPQSPRLGQSAGIKQREPRHTLP